METVFLYLSCALLSMIISLTVCFLLVILSRKEKKATESEIISGTFAEFYLKSWRIGRKIKGKGDSQGQYNRHTGKYIAGGF